MAPGTKENDKMAQSREEVVETMKDVLASELAAARGDHVRGLAAYEQVLRPAVKESQRIGPATMKLLIPRSRLQLWAMAQTMRLLPRLPAPARRRLTSFGGGPAAMLNAVQLRDPKTLP